MLRIGIISDTHSCWDDRFSRHFANCDEVWHAGDIGSIDVIQKLESIVPVVRAVRPDTLSFTVEQTPVFLTHIGGYPGRYAPGVTRRLLDSSARLFVCGHSHILKVMYDRELSLLHINPGAAGHHGWHKERTLVKLTVDGSDLRDLEVIELGKFIV